MWLHQASCCELRPCKPIRLIARSLARLANRAALAQNTTMLLSLRAGPLRAAPGWRHRRGFASAVRPPRSLRLLFCGSDDFSIHALRALHREHVSDSRLIEALHVVHRPGKRTGRGLKQIREGEQMLELRHNQ